MICSVFNSKGESEKGLSVCMKRNTSKTLFALNMIYLINTTKMGVRGRVVIVVDLVSIALHRCGFASRQGLWILSYEEVFMLANRTSVVLLRCPFMPLVLEIIHGGAHVFFHQ